MGMFAMCSMIGTTDEFASLCRSYGVSIEADSLDRYEYWITISKDGFSDSFTWASNYDAEKRLQALLNKINPEVK